MRPLIFLFLLCTVLTPDLTPEAHVRRFSITSKDSANESMPIFVMPEDTKVVPETSAEDLSAPPRFIMGKGEIRAELLVSFLLNENNDADREFTELLAGFYIAEAEIEGVNHDIAFAQMCLETGFLRFGGFVVPEMNNFCGLGAIGPEEPGIWFPSVEIGVRAHIQHLKAYACVQPMQRELVTPRYRFVRRGSAPVIQGLAGSWAADTLYAEKIELILQRLYSFRDEYLSTDGKNRN